VVDSANLTKIFEGLGMRGWFRYENTAPPTSCRRPRPGLADCSSKSTKPPLVTFVELEGPPGAIDRAATELGYSKRDYILTITWRYTPKTAAAKGQQPQNMLFANKSH